MGGRQPLPGNGCTQQPNTPNTVAGGVFVGSIALWNVLGCLTPRPRRLKGEDHLTVYPSDVLIFAGAPLVASAVLTLVRVRRSRRAGGRSGGSTS